ncbi:MAG: Mut7-C RNAse domain-containing protein [Anaerolineae bacterium]|nr:Mut7-C RNAse domain-containing protein [Anaerolineae bacterium]
MNCTFVADAMLGTLARWLRILGYDTLFDPAMDDHQLARLARAEGRVLLTRDRELAQRRGIDSVLIQSEHLDQQLVQLLAELELDCAGSFSRCPVCNERLVDLDREEARERVPAYVACTQEIFKLCPGCQRVYWRGSHRQQMEERLARLVTKRNGG